MGKSVCKVCPPVLSFSNALISDANEPKIGCFRRGSLIMWAAVWKGTSNLSFLTNYRPNFCSECGEKIVRLRWRLWTSRRFCDKCSAQICSNTDAAPSFSSDRFAGRRSVYRTSGQTKTIATGDRATRDYARGAELIERARRQSQLRTFTSVGRERRKARPAHDASMDQYAAGNTKVAGDAAGG